jgi:hypothetical protein
MRSPALRCQGSLHFVLPGGSVDMTQAAVSQLERRTDAYLSTLENFVETMGGRLEMYAVFPDGKVKLGLEREVS